MQKDLKNLHLRISHSGTEDTPKKQEKRHLQPGQSSSRCVHIYIYTHIYMWYICAHIYFNIYSIQQAHTSSAHATTSGCGRIRTGFFARAREREREREGERETYIHIHLYRPTHLAPTTPPVRAVEFALSSSSSSRERERACARARERERERERHTHIHI